MVEDDGGEGGEHKNISIVFNSKWFFYKIKGDKMNGWTRTEEDKQNFAVDVCGQLLLTYEKIFMGQ
jgi:hypothetical protein